MTETQPEPGTHAPPRRRVRLRVLLRWAYRIATLAYFSVALSILALRYAVLPEIDRYRPEVVATLTQAIGRPVSIASLEAQWQGLHPQLSMHGFTIYDDAGRPALALENVQAELSWLSALDWRLRLARLEVSGPSLDVRRDADGRVFVAGLAINSDEASGGFSDWLLAQRQIVIRDATLTWTDARRQAPPLALRAVNLRLDNSGRRHRFAITAAPPEALASRLDVRGDFRGRRLGELGEWHGSAYAELDYADLAVWRQWVDYPVDLPRGSGGLRLWLGVEGKRLDTLTADVALADVAVRLAPQLPMLELATLTGRLAAQLPQSGLAVQTRKLALQTRDGIVIAPTDLRLRWTAAVGKSVANGDISADGLDLGALNALAAYLPFDEVIRTRLADLSPRGKLSGLRLNWDEEGGLPQRYSFSANIERLGINPQGHLPGVDGLSGSIEGSERGGSLSLASADAALVMPQVFAVPSMPFDELRGAARWKAVEGGTQIELQNLSFRNADAAGHVSGLYRTRPDGPGQIDLTGRITDARGEAVWRYMPLAVNARVADWLHTSIRGARSAEARLTLKGDLKNWPFTPQRGGTFVVTGRFSGATLHYADAWPQIDDIDGELLFEGSRMLITAKKGRIFDVAVSDVSAEIADLNDHEERLLVKGVARGGTAGFLRFVDASPVAERINHFTEGMKADGAGSLQLNLILPLRDLDRSLIAGNFRFANNTIALDPAVPPIKEMSGSLQFTGNSISARNISARFLGEPLSLDAATAGGGVVELAVRGAVSAAALREQLALPGMDQLSGTTAWRGKLKLRGKQVELLIESTLAGLASTLPPPLSKSAADAMLLKIERDLGGLDGATDKGETWRASLGSLANLTLQRRRGADGTLSTRAAFGLGARPELPASGVALAADLPQLDMDAWRRLLAVSPASGSGAPATAGLAIATLSLKAQSLRAFGQTLTEVDLRGHPQQGSWLLDLKSREMGGQLQWDNAGKGRLKARLKQLSMAESKSAHEPAGQVADALQELPALDVTAEEFSLRGKALGALTLQAVNRGDTWRIDHLALVNADARFTADGQWRNAPGALTPSATSLDFKLEASDVGNLLERLGYANAVRRGSAKLAGKIGWSGAPTSIDFPSLEGNMTVSASNGQFNKLEPGVGRLLGILSLQSLPRRITLDFRDIFSEGFAFDSISGSIDAKRGRLETRDLQIQGPAAKILMRGGADLVAETQDLRVRVQPSIGESVAVGTALVNPLVGVATLLAQKLLRDPLDQIFSYEYAVSGSWSDPKVERVGAKSVETAQ